MALGTGTKIRVAWAAHRDPIERARDQRSPSAIDRRISAEPALVGQVDRSLPAGGLEQPESRLA